MEKRPIAYVRGFADDTYGSNQVVAVPFYGLFRPRKAGRREFK
jgi:hypothetical protein